MNNFVKISALSVLLSSTGCKAFVAPSQRRNVAFSKSRSSVIKMHASPPTDIISQETTNDVEALKKKAEKLRAEAAALEVMKAMERADEAEKDFKRFDTNNDGSLSLEEIKQGLEKVYKMNDIAESQVKNVIDFFDTSNDGKIQLDEFQAAGGIDRIRMKLDSLLREEKENALLADKKARDYEEKARREETRLSILNEKEPTNTDKLVSVLPYLLPLLDGIQFGQFLLQGHESNPVVTGYALLSTLYRSIPFGGLLAFIGLNFLSTNPSLNRLVRFNMQQAVNLDIAMFFPGLLIAACQFITSSLGVELPVSIPEVGGDAVFAMLLVTVAYASISSLVGIAPDKVPFISDFVNDRMLSIDMFDDEGRFIGPSRPDNKDENNNKKE